ncbi:secretion protein EspA, partial [Escherichia coli]|nr:secretion protein EspA [Escherichia coli]
MDTSTATSVASANASTSTSTVYDLGSMSKDEVVQLFN